MNVLFDMDGLMFDTEAVAIKAWDYAGEKSGLGKAGYMVYKTLGMNEDKIHSLWLEEFGDAFDAQRFHKYELEYGIDYYSHNPVPLKKGLLELLAYLKERHVPMAVASSSPRWMVERHLKAAEVWEYFSAVVCGDEIIASKPAPDIYLAAAAAIGAETKDCYALEDSPSGLRSAYAAGCKCIMVPDLWQPDEQTKSILTCLCKDLLEVRDYFLSL